MPLINGHKLWMRHWLHRNEAIAADRRIDSGQWPRNHHIDDILRKPAATFNKAVVNGHKIVAETPTTS